VNQEIAITKIQFDVNEIIKKGEQQIFDIANQKHKDGNTYRNSKVTWIKKWPELTQNIDKSISRFQKTWGFDLKTFEPLQYSNYNEGDYYDWHNDQHESAYGDGLIRKLSFTVFLNNEYEGGDFEICKLSGSKELPKINVTNISQKIITDEGGNEIGKFDTNYFKTPSKAIDELNRFFEILNEKGALNISTETKTSGGGKLLD